ncbi:uncharacterized protein LACBIDRAFT_322055 [Laccaria bicolor S238N-H82]|uniref:Predicted protein n=1 Tax=Laccaria bicolor (strain S238N-H82 / ATCC MYA-4686) TaxID=486041 RepID=B0CRZ5_LACBS|nr:uncharacterized protein LACBIDRAFT_322055 [Laccaria bicolor S238N-H82]EDR14205.1 predicted protein [Laccaria bicolor S238N-H82]|eukprot:XP_001874764.1 predicted protein [Laccaria bicolor S238N-H82]
MTLGKPPGSRKTKRSGTSSSVHVHHLYTSRSLSGRTSLRQEVLNATAIHKRQAKDRIDHTLRQDAMSAVERDELEAIRTNTTNDSGSRSVDDSNIEHDAWEMDVDAILAGAETIDISHAGGEFTALVDIADELLGPPNRRPRTRDYRTRRDRTQRRVDAFNIQLPALIEAYMGWMLQLGEDGYSGEYVLPPNAEVQATTTICEVDVYHIDYQVY